MHNQSSKIRVLVSNVRSIKGKLVEVQSLSPSYDILCLTETHLDQSILNSQIFDHKNKVVYRRDRNIHGGGVLIAINPEVEHREVHIESRAEIVALYLPSVGRNKTNGTVFVCVYNPPGKDIFEEEEHWLFTLQCQYPKDDLILVGDFNMPEIDWGSHTIRASASRKNVHQSFLNVFREFNLHQIVTDPTHVKGNILDLVCTTTEKLIEEVQVIDPGLSDHFFVCFLLKGFIPTPASNSKKIWLYNQADISSIDKYLQTTGSEVKTMISSGTDINEVWGHFEIALNTVKEKYIPQRQIKCRAPGEPIWFNALARKLVRKQRELYNKYKQNKLPFLLTDYKNMRRSNKKLFHEMKDGYMERFLYQPLEKGESKPFYSHVSNIRNTGSQVKGLIDSSGNLATEDFKVANIFNSYFHDVFNPPADSAGGLVGNLELADDDELDCLSDFKIERAGIAKLLKDLKSHKAPGPDGFGKSILNMSPQISFLLTDILNYSLQMGQLPRDWKLALVVPIHKNGDKLLPSNYRPISLTSVVCKLMERVVLHNLNAHLDKIIVNEQHGFRKNLSCNTQLVTVVHDILVRLNDKNGVQMATLDFAKAFDKVPHHLLILKLKAYEVPAQLVKWIESFLMDRYQKVAVNGVLSDPQRVTSGVPQGSVLGPSLFLFYINDITAGLTSQIRLFADDVLLYSTLSGPDQVRDFQGDLRTLGTWAAKWQMSFNVSKCNIMFIGKVDKELIETVNYELSGGFIQRVECTKYLGVNIAESMKWDHHIQAIVNKAYKILGLIKMTLWNAPMKVKLLAYKTLVRPIIEYASEVWDPYFAQDIDKLEMVQRKAVRFVADLRGRADVTKAVQELNLETLVQRRKSARIGLLLKIIANENMHESLMAYYNNLLSKKEKVQTRAAVKSLPRAPISTNDKFLHSFLIRTMKDLRISE